MSEKKGKKVVIMGGFASKKKSKHYGKYVRRLTEKVRLLQGEINEMMCEREKETRSYKSDLMVFAFKEAEWKQERKRLKEEVKRLRKMVEEKEERIRGIEDGRMVGEKSSGKGWQLLGTSTTSLLVEQMREERAWRDEAVEKWKRLYLAIKTELDDLIQRTDRGASLFLSFLHSHMNKHMCIHMYMRAHTNTHTLYEN